MSKTVPAQKGASRTRALALPLVKAGVSVALLALLFSRVDLSKLWSVTRSASMPWLAVGLCLYSLMLVASAWRWGLLLGAQGVSIPFRRLTDSFLVATFFNNFLPSNIGGDVIRIADTAPAVGSKTVATTVVLMDRGLGLLGLVLVAAVGATIGSRASDSTAETVGASALWAGFGLAAMVATPLLLNPEGVVKLLRPLRILHPEWVDERLGRFTAGLGRFREAPGALAACFAGAVIVQVILALFYLAIAYSIRIPIGFPELAVIIPISFIVQMIPLSVNGFGLREATFALYFSRLGLPLESALLLSFLGAALVMIVSLGGGAAYLSRLRRAHTPNVQHPTPV